MSDESKRELLTELDDEWHTLKHGNPVPGLYVQTGAEIVRVRGSSSGHGDTVYTNYEIVVSDFDGVVGTYRVRAEEAIAKVEEGMAGE